MNQNNKFISKIIFLIPSKKFNPINFKAKIIKVPKAIFKNSKINFNEKMNYRKILTLLYYVLIIYSVFSSLTVKCEIRRISSGFSYIILKTKATGNVKVFSGGDEIFPNEIYINGINQTDIKNEYNLDTPDSNITLIWYDKLRKTTNMFYNCKDITEIDLSNFDSSQIEVMSLMFSKCSSLIYLNFTNINTSKVITMSNMFYGCSSLSSLDLSSFETSSLKNMESMFQECSALNSLDLSSFNTSQVKSMSNMFCECSSLISVDLSSFETSNVESMEFMFKGCSALNSLDLSNFNTSQVTSMSNMFDKCSSLISLDLTNFIITQSTVVTKMFSECSKLEYINFQEADIDPNKLKTRNFLPNSDSIVICINNLEVDGDFTKNKTIKCKKNYFDVGNEYNCYSKSRIIYNKLSCGICDSNFYQLYNDEYNTNSIINCYESLKDYFTFYFYYNLTSKRFYCTENYNCPDDYNKLIEEKKQCIDDCERDDIYKYELNNICYNESKIEKTINKFEDRFNSRTVKEETKSDYVNYNPIMEVFVDTKEINIKSEHINELINNVIQIEEITEESNIIENRTELIKNIMEFDEDLYQKKVKAFLDEKEAVDDGHSTERIEKEIVRIIEEGKKHIS